MEFLKCRDYNDALKKGHCPFDVVCREDCYFSLLRQKESFEQLKEEYKELQDDYWEQQREESDYQELQSENEYQSEIINELTNLINTIVEQTEFPIGDILNDYNLGWAANQIKVKELN